MPESTNEIIVYQPDETIRLEVRLENETVWLTANQMARLFNRDEKTLRKHINNVFSEEVEKDNNTHFLRNKSGRCKICAYHLGHWIKATCK